MPGVYLRLWALREQSDMTVLDLVRGSTVCGQRTKDEPQPSASDSTEDAAGDGHRQ